MKKILVIDDHPAVMEGTKTILETDSNLSVDCLSPEPSEQFIKQHDFSSYDLILMDLNLGGEVNGMGFLNRFYKRILIVKLSCIPVMRSRIISRKRFVRVCTVPSAKRNLKKRSPNTYTTYSTEKF